MLRYFLALAALAGLAGDVAAQTQDPAWQVLKQRPKNAGTYHMVSRTWTRPNDRKLVPEGPNPTVYDNTMLWTGAAPNTLSWRGVNCCIEIYDDGRLPGTRNGPIGASDSYFINELTFGYVTFATPGTVDITLEFFDHLGGPVRRFRSSDDPAYGAVEPEPRERRHAAGRSDRVWRDRLASDARPVGRRRILHAGRGRWRLRQWQRQLQLVLPAQQPGGHDRRHARRPHHRGGSHPWTLRGLHVPDSLRQRPPGRFRAAPDWGPATSSG